MADDAPYLVDKPLGATPLEALGMLRGLKPELADQKLAYAGRLDPMATGLLVIAHGPWLGRQEELWAMPKEYDASVILGLTTDSYDLLGLATIGRPVAVPNERILAAAQGMVGKLTLSVPVFSSNRVAGKPLFTLAREGIPSDVAVPVRRMGVSEITVADVTDTTAATLTRTLYERIPLVKGDFRQVEILARWDEVLGDASQHWSVVQLHVRCGSGTYVRSLAHELGRRLACGAVLAGLRRTRVGPYTLDDPAVVAL